MGGFKITKESFKKTEKQDFLDIHKNETIEEKQLAREQAMRELGMSIEESIGVDERISEWKNNPAMNRKVLAVVPKKSAFLKDYLDVEEDTELKKLRQKYYGAKLDKKTAALSKTIKKQKKERQKKAMDLAKQYVLQERELEKWDGKHTAKIEGLRGEKKSRHLAGLIGKIQAFNEQSLFVGDLDSDAGIMKAFERFLKMDKDMHRLKLDTDHFRSSLDEKLVQDFSEKYNDYQAIREFVKRIVVKTAQGKSKTAADLEEINRYLGEKVLIKGTTAEMIFTDSTRQLKKGETAKQKKAKLEEALLNPDLTAEVQQLRRNDVPEIPLVNESRDLMDRSREIQEKWKKQGEETQVLDKKGNVVYVPHLNSNDVAPGGKWKPFLNENKEPEMIPKTVALNKEALRKKLKEQTQRKRYGGYTRKEIQDRINDPELPEAERLRLYQIYSVVENKQDPMRQHVRGYSGMAYESINGALRNGKYGKAKKDKRTGVWSDDVREMVDDLKKDISNELPEELCLTRHGDIGGLACMFGMPYSSVNNVEELMERIGQLPDGGFMIRDKAFLSTTIIRDGTLQGTFRQGQVEFRILAPKGTKGLYIEEMSIFPDSEQELLLDAGTIFRVTKIDASGKWDSKKATKANNKKVIVYMEAIPKKKAGDA